MRTRSLILSLLLATPFAAAGNLECNQMKQGMPTIYRCIYHGNLAQAYAALSTSRSEDRILRFNFPHHPHLPPALPTRNFSRHGKDLIDYDGDGKNEIYPLELTIRHQGSNRVQIDYMESNPGSIYGRKTLLRRKGRNVEIIIKDYAA